MIDRGDDQESLGDEIQRRYDLAVSREQKLLVLSEYMSSGMAIDALGFMEGDHQGDIVNLEDGNQPWGEQADPTVPAISPVGGVMIAGVYHAEGKHLSPQILARAGAAALAKIKALVPPNRDRSDRHQTTHAETHVGDSGLRDGMVRRRSGGPRLRSRASVWSSIHGKIELRAGDKVEVTPEARAKVMLLDRGNFLSYRLGLEYRCRKGCGLQTPVLLPAPHSGKWYVVVVNLGGPLKSLKASLRILPDRGGVR